MELTELYRQKRVLKAQLRKQAVAGSLVCTEGGLQRRPSGEIDEAAEIAGDTMEPAGLWLTSIENRNAKQFGGRVMLMSLETAAEFLTFGNAGVPSHRLSEIPEIESEKARQQALLNTRIAEGRNRSRKQDSRYGKKD